MPQGWASHSVASTKYMGFAFMRGRGSKWVQQHVQERLCVCKAASQWGNPQDAPHVALAELLTWPSFFQLFFHGGPGSAALPSVISAHPPSPAAHNLWKQTKEKPPLPQSTTLPALSGEGALRGHKALRLGTRGDEQGWWAPTAVPLGAGTQKPRDTQHCRLAIKGQWPRAPQGRKTEPDGRSRRAPETQAGQREPQVPLWSRGRQNRHCGLQTSAVPCAQIAS